MPSPLVSLEFDQLPMPAWVFELDGSVSQANPAAARLLGREVGDIVGKRAWDFAPGGEHIWAEVVRAAQERGVYRSDITLATPRGPCPIHYLLVLRSDETRSFLVVFGLERDASTEASRAERLHATQRLEALGLVAGGIAHDFNNQLTIVLAEATAAREGAQLATTSEESLRRIEASANRMAQLTRQLLAYAGRGRFVAELLDPDQLLDDARKQLQHAVKPSIGLSIALAAGRVVIEADRSLLLQVFVNLVANASDAHDGGGTIALATSAHVNADGTRWWQLQVRDQGVGMDPQTISRIWDPFFTTKTGHHGLGLSAVVGIARRLGGDIHVESRAGAGSLFTLRLPLAPSDAKPAPRRKPKETARGLSLDGMRALIADDEPAVRTTLRRLLERRNAIVTVANDGVQADALLREGPYAFIVLDVMMPGLTGYQLLPIAREMNPGARVMLMSGYTDLAHGTSHDDQPDAFLEKPFTSKTFNDAIDELLG